MVLEVEIKVEGRNKMGRLVWWEAGRIDKAFWEGSCRGGREGRINGMNRRVSVNMGGGMEKMRVKG